MSEEEDWENGQVFIYLHKEGDENTHTVGVGQIWSHEKQYWQKKKKKRVKGKEKEEKGRDPEKPEGGERELERTWEQGRVAVG